MVTVTHRHNVFNNNILGAIVALEKHEKSLLSFAYKLLK